VDLSVAVPEAKVSKEVLEPALESVTRLNEKMLDAGEIPTAEYGIDHDGIRWKPEPPGAERFDHAGLVMRRKWGDCDDLAPWHAASLRVTGEDHGAKAIVYPSGPGRWHAVVRRSDGSIDDPSRWAGMRRGVPAGVVGAVVRPMFDVGAGSFPDVSSRLMGEDEDDDGGEGGAPLRPSAPRGRRGHLARRRPAIGIRRVDGVGYVGRVDLPWADAQHMALSTLHKAPVAAQSIVGSILGACLIGEASGVSHEDDTRHLLAIAGLLSGTHPEELVELHGVEAVQRALPFCAGLANVVGFNFGKFLKGALPIASTIASFIPGVGPVLKTAADVVTMALTATDAHGGAPQVLSELAAVVVQ
jgi:hypothetical protein